MAIAQPIKIEKTIELEDLIREETPTPTPPPTPMLDSILDRAERKVRVVRTEVCSKGWERYKCVDWTGHVPHKITEKEVEGD